MQIEPLILYTYNGTTHITDHSCLFRGSTGHPSGFMHGGSTGRTRVGVGKRNFLSGRKFTKVVPLKRERYLIVLLVILCSFIACSMADESTELLAAPNPYPTPDVPVNGSVFAASFPTGAMISVDGVQRGLTNQMVTNIPPGAHNLTLKKTGYQTVTVPFELKAGESKVLAPITGRRDRSTSPRSPPTPRSPSTGSGRG
jgi:hypothetical protein